MPVPPACLSFSLGDVSHGTGVHHLGEADSLGFYRIYDCGVNISHLMAYLLSHFNLVSLLISFESHDIFYRASSDYPSLSPQSARAERRESETVHFGNVDAIDTICSCKRSLQLCTVVKSA